MVDKKVTKNIPSIAGILSKEFGDSYYGEALSFPTDNIYHRRCDAISKKLKEHDLHLNIFNHTFFKEEYYVLQSKNSEYIGRNDIINALDIPNDWIDLVSSNPLWTYFIKQKEFNEKYCNADGEIDFNDGDDWCIKNKSVIDIDLQLRAYGLHGKVTMDFLDGSYVCIITPNLVSAVPLEIAKALNLSVDDIEVYMGNFMVRL